MYKKKNAQLLGERAPSTLGNVTSAGIDSPTSAAPGWKRRNFTLWDVQGDTSTRRVDSGDLVSHGWTTTEILILEWDQHRVSVPESKQCEAALRAYKENKKKIHAICEPLGWQPSTDFLLPACFSKYCFIRGFFYFFNFQVLLRY